MPDRVGQQLGYYRLLRLLGSGGFAEVYLGEHIHLKKQAAVKVLRTQLSKHEADDFRREAQTLAHLDNPHIIRVLDFGFDHETPFLVMEYAPNGTLRQVHPRKTIVPLPVIIAYVKQIAEALYYAHNNNFIHRDVKPENMLLGRQNELLLSDFGIATVTQSSQASNPQSIAGTAIYMAPEQINGKPRPASDQYALAVIVYEWLVGAPPFQGSFIEISSQHLMTTPPHPRSRMPTIPVLVERVVMTALSKEPESRFGSISAFANALENAYLATQHPTPKPMPRPARPAGQPIRTAGPEPIGWSPTSPLPPSPSPVPPPIYSAEAFPNTLPALPKAKVSNLWWPTFFISMDERKEICGGTLPQEKLGISGSIPLLTNPLVPLPISNTSSQPMTGSLSGIQSPSGHYVPPAQSSPTAPKAPTGPIPSVKRSTRQAGAPTGPTGAGSPTGGIRRTSSPAGTTGAAGSTRRATWYAATSLSLASLALLVQAIVFIPAAGKAFYWAPWLVFTAAIIAFGYGVAGSRKQMPAGKMKTYAGIGVALSVFVALLGIAWIVYYNSYLLHLP